VVRKRGLRFRAIARSVREAGFRVIHEKNRQIGSGRLRGNVEEHFANPPAMVRSVVYEMHKHRATRHRRTFPGYKRERQFFSQRRVGLRVGPMLEPRVHVLICAAQIAQIGVHDYVTCREAVLLAFEVRLPDQIDHLHMV